MANSTAIVNDALLNTLVPLNVLAPPHREDLIEHASIVSLSPNEEFSAEYDGSNYTYYVLEGQLGIYEGDRLIDTIVGGNESAKFALNQIRSSQVHAKAQTDVSLLCIEISLISTLLLWVQSAAAEGNNRLTVEDSTGWVPTVLASELFARMAPANILKIFRHLENVSTKAGEVVISQGDEGDYYYIIRKGECVVSRALEQSKQSVQLATLGPGDSFGEEALIANARRNATITMLTDGELLRLTKDHFRDLISDPLIREVDAIEASALISQGHQWIDVRQLSEHKENGLQDSLCLPVTKLRQLSSDLPQDQGFVIYSNSGIRSTAGAFMLTELGFNALALKGGLHGNAILLEKATPTTEKLSHEELPDWVKELEKAHDAVEGALQDKLEATTARRIWASEVDTTEQNADARIQAKKQKLELESATASAALASALRTKLEIESKLRSSEADAARRRAQAEAECDGLRQRAEAMLNDEQKRLQLQYSEAATRLDELKRERERTEEHLRQERERIEQEFHASQQTLQFEAKKIKEELERVRQEVEEKAQKIRSDEANKEKQVRQDTETSLRQERLNLERQFASSVADLERAQKKLETAEAAKSEADEEARRIADAMRREADKRRAAAEAERAAEQARLSEKVQVAGESLDDAQREKERVESDRRALMQKLARIRAASGEVDDGLDTEQVSEDVHTLAAEIERYDESVSSAIGKVDAAQRAKDTADAVRLAAEEKAARQREMEEELRLQLHEEAEVWLQQEQARSQAELDNAKQELASKWAMKEEAEIKRREVEAESGTLLSDISAQLADPDVSLEAAIGNKAYAEEKHQLAEEARQALDQTKQETEEALEAARAHMIQLRRQGLLD